MVMIKAACKFAAFFAPLFIWYSQFAFKNLEVRKLYFSAANNFCL